MCKKTKLLFLTVQQNLKIISLDTGLRLDGFACLTTDAIKRAWGTHFAWQDLLEEVGGPVCYAESRSTPAICDPFWTLMTNSYPKSPDRFEIAVQSSHVPTRSSSAKRPIAFKSPGILIATGKPESRMRRNSSDAASSSQVRLEDAYFGGLMEKQRRNRRNKRGVRRCGPFRI